MTGHALDGLAYIAMVNAIAGLAATLLDAPTVGLPLMGIAGIIALYVIVRTTTRDT